MRFELESYHRGITDEELLAELRRIATHLNKSTVTRADNDDLGKFGSHTYVRRFGNWFEALEKAGLKQSRSPMNIGIEELFLNLKEVWVRLGRQPRYVEMQKPLSRYSAGTYENRFGTWRKALEQFVNYINGESDRDVDPDSGNAGSSNIAERSSRRGINWRLRFIVMRRDNFRCVTCGRSPAADPSIILHIDHIKPWSKGGGSAPDNLQTLCSVCNIGKSDLE